MTLGTMIGHKIVQYLQLANLSRGNYTQAVESPMSKTLIWEALDNALNCFTMFNCRIMSTSNHSNQEGFNVITENDRGEVRRESKTYDNVPDVIIKYRNFYPVVTEVSK